MFISNRKCHYVPVFVLVVLVLVSLACGETPATSEPTVRTATPEAAETQTQLDEETNTAEPFVETSDTPESTIQPTPTSEPTPLYLGDIVEQHGYLLSAVAVEDPATPGMFFEPEAGKKLVAVEVIVGNVNGEALSVNPLYFTLLDSEGFAYQAELGGREQQIVTVDLGPGEKARGWVAYVLPEGADAASIKYSVEIFGDKILQVGLTPPPEGYVPVMDALAVLPPSLEAGLGDVLEQDGYSLTATAVEDPTTPGMFYQPQEGRKLVAVEIVVGNLSGEMLSVNPLNALLVDSNGFVYTPELAGRDGQIDTMDLNAGERVKGWVAFELPTDAVPASIKYLVEYFSDKILQVGLVE